MPLIMISFVWNHSASYCDFYSHAFSLQLLMNCLSNCVLHKQYDSATLQVLQPMAMQLSNESCATIGWNTCDKSHYFSKTWYRFIVLIDFICISKKCQVVTPHALSSLGILKAVMSTAFNSPCDDKAGHVTIFPFQYCLAVQWTEFLSIDIITTDRFAVPFPLSGGVLASFSSFLCGVILICFKFCSYLPFRSQRITIRFVDFYSASIYLARKLW